MEAKQVKQIRRQKNICKTREQEGEKTENNTNETEINNLLEKGSKQ